MSTTSRIVRIVGGATMVVAGFAALTVTASASASAAMPDSGRSHDAMHNMMVAMHGAGTADRMHAVDDGEQMMDDCAQMQVMMGGMGGGMMDGRGKQGDDR